PPPQALLRVEKKADVTQCSDLGGGCQFTITVTNPGPGDFKGQLELSDVVKVDGQVPANMQIGISSGSTAPVLAPSWQASPQGVTCKTTDNRPAVIPAGKSFEVRINVKPGATPNGKELKNCASIRSGAGESCATIPLKQGPLLRAFKLAHADTCTPKCLFSVA